MTINWPTTPNVGDQITGPRGEIWEWDGVKWVSIVTPGGGAGGPQMGVTDGSSAASGQVGENIVASNYLPAAFSADVNGLATISGTLPPGDWDVTVFIFITLFSFTVSSNAYFNFVTNPYSDIASYTANGFVDAGGQCIMIFGPVRLSSASTITFSTSLVTNFATFTTPNILTKVRARRMR